MKTLVLAGESFRAIGRELGVSHQAVSKRASKHGWDVPKGRRWQPGLGECKTARIFANPKTMSDKSLVARGKRTPENLEQILVNVRRCVSPENAAVMAGLTVDIYKRWIEDDPDIAEYVECAVRESLGDAETSMHQSSRRGDLRATQAILKHPLTRARWEPANAGTGGPSISVVVNVPDPKMVLPPTIDITPTETDE